MSDSKVGQGKSQEHGMGNEGCVAGGGRASPSQACAFYFAVPGTGTMAAHAASASRQSGRHAAFRSPFPGSISVPLFFEPNQGQTDSPGQIPGPWRRLRYFLTAE